MPVGKKWMVVVSVMATGMTAALFFRKDASQVVVSQPSQVDYLFGEHVERRVAIDSSRAPAPALPIPTTRPARPKARRVTAAQPASISDGVPNSGDVQPTFHKSLNPVGALLPPVEGIVDEQTSELVATEPPAESFDPPSTASQARHQIRDGDTLSTLAEQYLGGADRYLEIFDMNRDVLATPDLLPIGTVLRIPPREAKTSTVQDGKSSHEPRSGFEPELPLVPIERPNLEPVPDGDDSRDISTDRET